MSEIKRADENMLCLVITVKHDNIRFYQKLRGGTMLIKQKYLVLGLLLITIFSLNTVFGTQLAEAHPKKHIDRTSSFSQSYTPHVNDLESHPTQCIFEHVYLLGQNLVSTVYSYQATVMVTLLQQKRVILLITAFSNSNFVYLQRKILSPRKSTIS